MAEARKLYLARRVYRKYWENFEDFSFCRNKVVDVYYVGGFGVMIWVAYVPQECDAGVMPAPRVFKRT